MALFLSSTCTLGEDDLAGLTKTFRASMLHKETFEKLDAIPWKDRPFEFDPYDYPRPT